MSWADASRGVQGAVQQQLLRRMQEQQLAAQQQERDRRAAIETRTADRADQELALRAGEHAASQARQGRLDEEAAQQHTATQAEHLGNQIPPGLMEPTDPAIETMQQGGLGALLIPNKTLASTEYSPGEGGRIRTTSRPSDEVTQSVSKLPSQKQLETTAETALKTQAAQATQARQGVIDQRAAATATETARHNRAMEARPVGGSTAHGGPGSVTMSPEAVDYAASQIRLTNNMAMLNRLNDDDRKTILNSVALQTKALGQSPVNAIQKQAAFKADGAALTKMTTMAAAAQAFETKANAQADLVRTLSANVPRTAWPLVNGVLQTGRVATGNTDAHLFANALLTFTTEYAKLMEGATGSVGGSSEGGRRDAAKLISTALTNGTIDKTLTQMQWEMGQTMNGYDVTLKHITERMGGGSPGGQPAATPPATTPPAPAMTPADYIKKYGG